MLCVHLRGRIAGTYRDGEQRRPEGATSRSRWSSRPSRRPRQVQRLLAAAFPCFSNEEPIEADGPPNAFRVSAPSSNLFLGAE